LRQLITERWREVPEGAPPQPPKRPRGRPPRSVDRAALVAALAKHEGSIRAAARESDLSRSTFARRAAAVPDWAWAYGPEVLEPHAKLLHDSAVLPGVARARGYESMRGPERPDKAGLLVPIWTVHGRRVWSQLRYDRPRDHRNRYENARDAFAVVDCSPAARPRVLDPDQPLYVTESPRKADAAVSHGLACVDFPGIRMLRLDDETWEYIGVSGRDVRVCFDGDVAIKGDVEAAEWWLCEYLSGKGARVTVYRLPVNQGLDDYLASGKAIEALPVAKLSVHAPDVWRVGWSPRRGRADERRERR